MVLFWLALAFSMVSIVGSAVFATRRGIGLFRAFRKLAGDLGDGLENIGRSSDQIERHLTLAAESGTRLDASLARLRTARAQLNVQRAAIADVQASLGRITGVAPRK